MIFVFQDAGHMVFLWQLMLSEWGKKPYTWGGATQMLFGIKGKRWEDEYGEFMNEHWIRPSKEETPINAMKIENGCYW